MPEVVLTHPDLPDQPIIVPAEHGAVSDALKDAGWVIDKTADADETRELLKQRALDAEVAALSAPPVEFRFESDAAAAVDPDSHPSPYSSPSPADSTSSPDPADFTHEGN